VAKYNLDVVVRWAKVGSQPAGDYAFLCGRGNNNHHLGSNFNVHKGIRTVVKRE